MNHKDLDTSDCGRINSKENSENYKENLSADFYRYLTRHLGRSLESDMHYRYIALSYAIRDYLVPIWHDTRARYQKPKKRMAYYLSLEYLIGRVLSNYLLNLDLQKEITDILEEHSMSLEELIEEEHDAGLGNGGLGRLAACFLDSCASLSLPVIGYGIRYEYGMFNQNIENGYQIERPEHWLHKGNPWEFVAPEFTQTVIFGGHTEVVKGDDGKDCVFWHASEHVLALPYDMPIPGYRNDTVNTLRLWKATTTDTFDLEEFNAGDYTDALAAKTRAEHITMVLYPNDASESGKELRLKQQYFLASASLQDVCRIWERNHDDYTDFEDYNVFQLNDTHPTVAIAELMRILIDLKGLNWQDAWHITYESMAYTNHTLLPEALEKWSLSMFGRLLPRLMEIIYRINSEFLQQVAMRWPDDTDRLHRMSIIEEGDDKYVRMAYLGIIGSHSVNGVSALHTNLLTEQIFRDFYELWPQKFNNKTNGVTPRRWIGHANPELSKLISEKIGSDWTSDLQHLCKLKQYAESGQGEFQSRWATVRRRNKQRLTDLVYRYCNVKFDTESLFDVQVKRIHEYKRQLLNLLHVMHLYARIKNGQTENWVNRCVLIGGKAAPGYHRAKMIIKLTNNIANVINNDQEVGERLKLAFLPNYCVSFMEIIAPGTDLSEQISTAGKEASGTGNMKFMMNGAITIGTYDGANIEILREVGEDNFFLFGLSAQEIETVKENYNPQRLIDNDTDLFQAFNLLHSGLFNTSEPGIFDDLIHSMIDSHDPWMTLADFRSFVDTQERVAQLYQNQDLWIKKSILNTASSGIFSSDHTIQEYNQDIWQLKPIPA